MLLTSPVRWALVSCILSFMTLGNGCAQAANRTDDPYLWLEEVEGAKAIEWVKARSDRAVAELRGDARYTALEADIRKVVLAQDRIPFPALRDGWLYNFWQDATHVRGLWRRTRPEEYEKAAPNWETLLDLDELARQEKENWVWAGSNCLPPKYERCLLSFSRGGGDAHVVREFDLATRSFVADGFKLPEAKSNVAWKDENTVLVGTDFGSGSMTRSGYPRIVKVWKRGTSLAEATTLFEGFEEDVWVSGHVSFRPEGRHTFVMRGPSFFEQETQEVIEVAKDGEAVTPRLRKLPFPLDSSFQGPFHGSFLVQIRSDWKTPAGTFTAGSLLALPIASLEKPEPLRKLEAVFVPKARESIASVTHTEDALYLDVLEKVKGRIYRVAREGKSWKRHAVKFPDHGAVSVVAADPYAKTVLAQFESFLIPASLYRFEDVARAPHVIKRIPERFSAQGLVVEQFEAASTDGTPVPYFLVHRQGLKLDGSHPTLLYGYGGFEVSMTPHYLDILGKAWLEKGGVYALANIRGGGEFGPAWHQAALKLNRQRAYDDFAAVATDLISRKLTSPRRLGIMGGSNGGLLVGATFVQRPELFNAVICQVPLLDMLRYHKLLAGHSWMAEYGDPENPTEAAAILKYSPYQNVRAGVRYPKILFVTSMKDDRVHPGHARKMAARMEEQGHSLLYYENMEGGHSAAANLEQRIKRSALEYTYLHEQLFD